MSRSSDEITINIKELIDEFGADDISIALEEFMKALEYYNGIINKRIKGGNDLK